MTDLKIGLAFGGGGARGLAHIQAIRAFEDLGVRPSVIAGSSIGGICAALYAAGYTSEKMLELAEYASNNRLRLFAEFLMAEPSPSLAKFDLDMFRLGEIDLGRALSVIFPDDFPKTFEELEIPIHIVATNYYKQEETTFSSGRLIPALAASAAVPAIFLPVVKENQVYIDGSATNPVPFDTISGKADIIVAINVTGISKGNRKRRPRKVDVLTSSNYIMQQAIVDNKARQHKPDVIVRPDIAGVRVADFAKVQKILDHSEQLRIEVREKLGKILQEKQEKQ